MGRVMKRTIEIDDTQPQTGGERIQHTRALTAKIRAADAMHSRIKAHGEQLLAIFPHAQEKDPVKLCKKLRRYEGKAARLALNWCNGDTPTEHWDAESNRISDAVNRLLGRMGPRVWVNGDARGYALKVDLAPDQKLHRDWGDYGIIAPNLTDAA